MSRWIYLLGVVVLVACDVEDVDAEIEIQQGTPCDAQEDSVPCTVSTESTDATEMSGDQEPLEGIRYCDQVPGNGSDVPPSLQWGECITNPECDLGTKRWCGGGYINCELRHGKPTWVNGGGADFDACNTPLVLSFDAAPVRMDPSPAASFDIDDIGACVTTDWPSSVTPWLALDVDRDGLVETGAELFGSGTRLADGRRARNGFEALATLDSNGDGRISAADERFGELLLWSDTDRDKRGTRLELEPLAARGIVSIELAHAVDRRCDARGNCEVERARFELVDGSGRVRSGEVVDIHLACQ